ncbi:hypothetical protein M8818_002100 [Zalaria obscura]|uniref:Uncharacterized protein n=1 Tax=Zalaria obscura TaxID=2024903 RepID=A0ACC3SJX4_9PEZI
MSSRALRKALREKEEQEQLRKLQQEEEEEEEESEGEEEETTPAPAKQSVFALLNTEDDDEVADDEEGEEDTSAAAPAEQSQSEEEETIERTSTPASKSKRKKNKKKKGKAAGKSSTATPVKAADSSIDDIDEALKSLSTSKSGKDTPSNDTVDPVAAETCRLLAVDTQHLHASNEMRRLFGRAALEPEHEEEAPGGGRRRGRGGQQMGLAAALRGRQAGGRGGGLAAIGLRRNIFIQGKEEWPQATGGGLAMEMVEKRPDGTTEYRFVHNRAYQDVQSQFEDCVASMDPNRMIALLQYNPYHISTLLQVSEIAKQERDRATEGDLIERALFSFGRAVHSSFSTNLSQGKARLDFRRPENREFWLAATRYISNLGMRSTWRTVYEWTRLLLSLDPENDPYRMSLVLDQYALRARQPQSFLDLSSSTAFATKWKTLPNIQLSRGLALIQTANAAKGKQTLYTAISKFPWVVARLFQELNLDPPPAVWGKEPRTDAEKLQQELYATRAKDVWNTPEATDVLVEVSAAVSPDVAPPPVQDSPIAVDDARHVLMTDTPALIALLPRALTARVASASDPLPPENNLVTYTPSSRRGHGHGGRSGAAPAPDADADAQQSPAESLRELQGLYGFFANLFPWFNPSGEGEAPQMNEEEIERRIQESGISEEVIVERTQRMMMLQNRLVGGVDSGEGQGLEGSGEGDGEGVGHGMDGDEAQE